MAAATTTPANYILLQSDDGSDGDCRSGGQQLPYVYNGGASTDLTACSVACNMIEECVAFAFVNRGTPEFGNCQLTGIDIGLDLLPANEWPNANAGGYSFGSGVVDGVDTAYGGGGGYKCYVKGPTTTTVAAATTTNGYTLLQADGVDGDCRSGGKQLPYLSTGTLASMDLTACSDACNKIKECAAFAFMPGETYNCELTGLNMALDLLPRNAWPTFRPGNSPFEPGEPGFTGIVDTVDTSFTMYGMVVYKCYVRDLSTPAATTAGAAANPPPPPPPPAARTPQMGGTATLASTESTQSSSGLTPLQIALLAFGGTTLGVSGVVYTKWDDIKERLPAWAPGIETDDTAQINLL